MPRDLIERIDLDRLYPPFLDRMLEMVAQCRARGADYFAICGHRTYTEQDALYAKGRTEKGPVVTNARAGESFHNFGLAVDFCRDGLVDRRGLQPDWRPESYLILGEEAAGQGLEWAGRWKRFKEYPHVQWSVPPATFLKVRHEFERAGLKAAWKVLDGTRATA